MNAKIKIITAMVTFGTIGVFVRYIPLPSSIIALVRGVLATIFLLTVMAAGKRRPDRTAIRRNLALLVISGGMIGFNWILLFEAYNYTSVAVATLCYYLAPVFVIIASPFVLGEKLTMRKTLCVISALAGMVMVSGVIQNYVSGGNAEDLNLTGVLLGIGAGALYATIILMNKKLKNISSYDTTVMQLAAASIVLVPYCLLTVDIGSLEVTPGSAVLLVIVGIVHTGIAYVLYFGSIKELPAQTVAIFSYIDPILAVLLSAFLLKESMDMLSISGAILILGSTFVSEMKGKAND
ncbi:MAG: DMT family transporter [Anaerovoracaceae bacterium]|nr:DMT family transporter [Bacillota bacterium]MDY5771281.1 DMT family transporter [Anaerovoracaceae bacterium]